MRAPVLAALTLIAALLAAPGAAASPAAVVRDCAADGSLDGPHSDDDKRAALREIPADVDEYSDCRAVIGRAIGDRRAAARARASSIRLRATAADDGRVARKPAAGRRKRVRGTPGARARAGQAREAAGSPAVEVRARDANGGVANPLDAALATSAGTTSSTRQGLRAGLIALALLTVGLLLLVLWRHSAAFAGIGRRFTPRRFRR